MNQNDFYLIKNMRACYPDRSHSALITSESGDILQVSSIKHCVLSVYLDSQMCHEILGKKKEKAEVYSYIHFFMGDNIFICSDRHKKNIFTDGFQNIF